MQYLSLHIIFSIKVDIRQYQECIQNGQNMNFDFFAPEFGALPILQDCPGMGCLPNTLPSIPPFWGDVNVKKWSPFLRSVTFDDVGQKCQISNMILYIFQTHHPTT